MKAKKIGLVTPFFLPAIGGANIYCYEFAKALAAKGHEVHLFTVAGALADPAYILYPVLTLDLRRDLRELRNYEMDIWHALFFFYAPLALYRENVFVTGHGDDCMTLQVRARLPGRRFLERHLLWRLGRGARQAADRVLVRLERALTRRMHRRALRRIRRVVTVSSYTKAKLEQRYPRAAGKVTVVPVGVSERFFAAPDSAPRPGDGVTTLLTVTRLDEKDRIKNVHGVIAALAQLRDAYRFRYRIISGSQYGGYRAELERQIAAAGLGARVTIEGRMSDAEIVAAYRGADLFVLVSYAEPDNFEGFGIVFLEANACGVPVLSSREGGMADYIVEGGNGFYVSAPTPDGIRAALQRFLDGAISFDRGAIRSYPEQYRWTHITDRILQIYDGYSR